MQWRRQVCDKKLNILYILVKDMDVYIKPISFGILCVQLVYSSLGIIKSCHMKLALHAFKVEQDGNLYSGHDLTISFADLLFQWTIDLP